MSSASSMAQRNIALTANRNSSNNNGPVLKPQLLPNTSAGKKSTSTQPIKPIRSSSSFYNGCGSGHMPRKPGDRGKPSSQRSFPNADRPAPAYRPPDMSSIGMSPPAYRPPDSLGTSVSATAQPSTPRERRKQLVEGGRQSRSRDTGNVTRRPRSRSADRLRGSHTSAQQQNYNKSYCDHEQVYKTEKRESRSRERNATPRSKSHSTDRGATTPRLDRVQHKAQESSRTATESGITNTVQKMSLTASNAQQKSTKETQRGLYSQDTGNSTPGYPPAGSHGTTSSRQHQSLHDNTGTGNRTSSSELVAAETHRPSFQASQSHYTSIRNSAAGPVSEGRVSNDRVTTLDQISSAAPSPHRGGHTYPPSSYSPTSPTSHTSPPNSYRPSSPALSTRNKLSTSGGKVGIANLGNTCFMNSMLQCLGQTGEMAQLFLDQKSSSFSRSGLVKAYSDFTWEMWRGSESSSRYSRTLYPRELKDCFSKKNPQFHGYNQHDSQEFMRFLVAGLHEELKKQHRNKPDVPRNENPEEWWQWYKTLEDSDLFSIFVGQLRSSLKCKACNEESLTFDPFWELSVSLPKHHSTKYSISTHSVHLQDCLDIFTREEVLDGAEMPYCVKCKCPQPCIKKMTIERIPRVLVIHLKRFSVHMSRFSGYGHRSKLDTPVMIPHQLNLYKYTGTSQSAPAPPGYNYELYAVSNHSGTVYFGHYTAWCKHYSDRKWYSYNDSNVSPHTLHGPDFSSSTAYVLFYRLKKKEKSTIV